MRAATWRPTRRCRSTRSRCAVPRRAPELVPGPAGSFPGSAIASPLRSTVRPGTVSRILSLAYGNAMKASACIAAIPLLALASCPTGHTPRGWCRRRQDPCWPSWMPRSWNLGSGTLRPARRAGTDHLRGQSRRRRSGFAVALHGIDRRSGRGGRADRSVGCGWLEVDQGLSASPPRRVRSGPCRRCPERSSRHRACSLQPLNRGRDARGALFRRAEPATTYLNQVAGTHYCSTPGRAKAFAASRSASMTFSKSSPSTL
jgi:hypothetical protein